MSLRDPLGWIGQTIAGKLRVETVVAEGGFAVVYRARRLGFDARVTLILVETRYGFHVIRRAR